MRLINTKTLELEEFYGTSIPSYAILSHTWGLQKDEVSFQDWQSSREEASKKPGCSKIIGTCQQALSDTLRYAWIDTLCIDKTSSAELSEAINSMFAWYRNAAICYVYLSDLSKPIGDIFSQEQFSASRWFTRGWTLQEPLAPYAVIFFSCEWIYLGSKDSLTTSISKITGIDPEYLLGPKNVTDASVSEKMYWASRRTTTRAEDIAYCLLGIFDIAMPLLYGEGSKAFVRLQEEISRVYPDHTLFCWSWIDKYVPSDWGSVLAPCPFVFQSSKGFQPILYGSSHSMKTTGLSVEARIIEGWRYDLMVLRATFNRSNGDLIPDTHLCLPIYLVPGRSSYVRIRGPTSHPLSIPLYWINRFPIKKILIEGMMRTSRRRYYGFHERRNMGHNFRNGCYMAFNFKGTPFQGQSEIGAEADMAYSHINECQLNPALYQIHSPTGSSCKIRWTKLVELSCCFRNIRRKVWYTQAHVSD